MCQETRLEERSPIHVGFTNERFYAGTHMCLVFRDETDRKKIVSKFVESGIMDDEKIGYFADTATPSEVAEWLKELDIDLETALAEGSVSIDEAETVYCGGGTFVPETMLEKLKNSYTESKNKGYRNARVTGEMSWALKGIPGSHRLIEYESKINKVVETHPVTAMCQYDANKFSGSLIYKALQVHPYMVVNGQLVENPYYIQEE